MNLECDFIRIDGTIMPGVAGISVEHDMLRGVVRTLGGRLQVDRLGNAGVSNAWTVRFSGLSEAEKSFILFHVLSDSGVRRVAFFNTVGFDALVSVTRDEYVPRWDVTRTYRQHASGALTLRVEALALTPPFTAGSVNAARVNNELVFRSGVQIVPSTFTRASQAMGKNGLVPEDTMRLVGEASPTPAVLIEGQRTNLIKGSNAMSSLTYWTVAGSAPTSKVANAGIAPDGTLSATLFTVDNIGATGSMYAFVDVTPETDYTFTYYAKQLSGSGLRNGVYNHTASSWIRPETEHVFSGDGWERVTITLTTPADCTSIRVYPMRWHGTSVFSVLLWGAQVEQASFASSYIPTEGAPATRAQDTLRADSVAAGLTGAFTIATGFFVADSSERQIAWELGRGGGASLRFSTRWNTSAARLYTTGISPIVNTYFNPNYEAVNSHIVTYDGSGTVRNFMNGVLTHEAAGVPLPLFTELAVGALVSGSYPVWGAISPGAAALGIPFIDNRAWSAEEVQAAHARWLPELAKIEVPV